MQVNELIERLERTENELNKLNGSCIYVGVDPKNDHMTMIALVQEYGKHIAAKNYPYLVIPVQSGAKGRKASAIPGLYKRGMTLGVNDNDSPNGFLVCFVLKKSVDIPARPFLRYSFNHNLSKWDSLMGRCAQRVVNGDLTANNALQITADCVQDDIRQTIKQMRTPANAPLTIANKGRDNPLVDKGNLTNSIQTFIFRKDDSNV